MCYVYNYLYTIAAYTNPVVQMALANQLTKIEGNALYCKDVGATAIKKIA